MDRRLQARYQRLVKAHMHSKPRTAAGPSLGCDRVAGFAATQATWRFLNNERVTLPALVEPLREAGREAVRRQGLEFALLMHDWCKLDYRRHTAKRDVVQLTHATDVGYELTTALLVSPADGAPLAPMEMHLKTAAGLHSTRADEPLPSVHHLEQVLPTMEAAASWGLPAACVHVIDREADSVGHFRDWDDAGHLFLVRADDRKVRWRGAETLLSEIAATLETEGVFRDVHAVVYHGRPARQHVAATEVILHRSAKKRIGGKQRAVAGLPLSLRLVVAQVCDEAGRRLAQWLLLTNVPAETADAEQVALWYYWRWRIESFFKLLKSSGHEVEHWQQETGLAIARRRLVAAMACVAVWDLERQQTPEAEELKHLLVRLSGRQMKRRRLVTPSALLAGLFVLLPILELLRDYDGDLRDLRNIVATVIPLIDTG